MHTVDLPSDFTKQSSSALTPCTQLGLQFLTAREVHDAFFFALDESSKKFHALGMQAFEEAEIVQNGLRLANDVLYQLLPVISEMQPYQENYRKVNKLFWGKFFYLNGLDKAKKFEGSYATSPWEIARFYASEFWRFVP